MKFPRSLRSAMAESSNVLEHRGKIRQVISKAGQDRQAFAANMTDVQQRLATEEADQALSDDPSAAPGPARKALSCGTGSGGGDRGADRRNRGEARRERGGIGRSSSDLRFLSMATIASSAWARSRRTGIACLPSR